MINYPKKIYVSSPFYFVYVFGVMFWKLYFPIVNNSNLFLILSLIFKKYRKTGYIQEIFVCAKYRGKNYFKCLNVGITFITFIAKYVTTTCIQIAGL